MMSIEQYSIFQKVEEFFDQSKAGEVWGDGVS
jgi:hypothetical protein